jgi:hypothetical protein
MPYPPVKYVQNCLHHLSRRLRRHDDFTYGQNPEPRSVGSDANVSMGVKPAQYPDANDLRQNDWGGSNQSAYIDEAIKRR